MNNVYNALLRLTGAISEFKPGGKLLGSVASNGIAGGYRLFACEIQGYSGYQAGSFIFYPPSDKNADDRPAYGSINLDNEKWWALVHGNPPPKVRERARTTIGPFELPSDAIYALLDANHAQREPIVTECG